MMMKNRPLSAIVLASALATALAPGASAAPPVRGEMARLQRQIYDWAYRNSNHNVFRSSRHFHPTQNAFRSSAYYKRRLAASFDGYPLRTRETVKRTINGREFVETWDFVHPRRHPAGPPPSDFPYGFVDPALDGTPQEIVDAQYAALEAPPEAMTEEQQRIRSRADLDMAPVREVVITRPAREAVLVRETLPDGSVRTVITNVE